MFFLNNNEFENDEFIKECKTALVRKESDSQIKQQKEFLFETNLKFNRIKTNFEEFDPTLFETKLRVDTLIYNKLFKNLDESHSPVVENLIIDLYGTVKSIYEFVNIQPEIYKSISPSVLNLNEGEIETIIHDYIYEFLDNEYYNLTPQKRQQKYFNNCKDFAANLIHEGIEPNDAILHTLKTNLMENFLKKITFPYVYPHIHSLTEDVDFGVVFDQEKLVDYIKLFETKIHKLSRIIAECI